ncbi:hypothetical protein HMPREF0201_01330 [Cedecea davisae DSM 4568]|uniref:Uncharacterized protein n=1 Tax=Cedecea davisae DSM 4568 TaxID=566551 RepID=S3J0N8_9ENTR|nr:hypothetical protein HMPREF0201_01330 [Cedecea davisae DSM 4568]
MKQDHNIWQGKGGWQFVPHRPKAGYNALNHLMFRVLNKMCGNRISAVFTCAIKPEETVLAPLIFFLHHMRKMKILRGNIPATGID